MNDLLTFKNKLYLPFILESLVFVKKILLNTIYFVKLKEQKWHSTIGNALARECYVITSI